MAGDGEGVYRGDGVPAVSTALAYPGGVAADAAGNIYIADSGNSRVRKVGTDGIIHTMAGGDRPGITGDGGPAAQALLLNPRALAFDLDGNLLITDSSAHMIRRITPAGIIERVSGTGKPGSAGDGGPATAAQDWTPWGIAVDAAGNIYVGDTGSTSIRMIDRGGTIHTLLHATGWGLAADAAVDIWIAGGGLSSGSPSGAAPPLAFAPSIADCALCTNFAGITSTASGQRSAVAPGEMVTINGAYLGPHTAVSGTWDGFRLSSSLSGVQVLFDGVAAPLLKVQTGQIQAIAPFEIDGKTTVAVTVEYGGRSSSPAVMAVLPAVPGLFISSASGYTAAALNQDGSVNSYGYPASRGSILSLFVTGAGQTIPGGTDGQVETLGPVLVQPVFAFLTNTAAGGWQPVEVTYAGNAPGLVSSALQINVRLPDHLTPQYSTVTVMIAAGNAPSQAVSVFVKAAN